MAHDLAWARTAAALRRDADEGLLPPLPCGAVPDYKAGAWEEPAKKAEPEGVGIFIGNLPRTVTHAVLTELCVQMGPLDPEKMSSAVRLLKDHVTGLPNGKGFCDYADAASARYAIAVLNDLSVGGQRLRVNLSDAGPGRPPSRTPSGGPGGPALPFVRPQWSARDAGDDERRGRDERRRYDDDDDEYGHHRRERYTDERSHRQLPSQPPPPSLVAAAVAARESSEGGGRRRDYYDERYDEPERDRRRDRDRGDRDRGDRDRDDRDRDRDRDRRRRFTEEERPRHDERYERYERGVDPRDRYR